jgi:hypothetical protein
VFSGTKNTAAGCCASGDGFGVGGIFEVGIGYQEAAELLIIHRSFATPEVQFEGELAIVLGFDLIELLRLSRDIRISSDALFLVGRSKTIEFNAGFFAP